MLVLFRLLPKPQPRSPLAVPAPGPYHSCSRCGLYRNRFRSDPIWNLVKPKHDWSNLDPTFDSPYHALMPTLRYTSSPFIFVLLVLFALAIMLFCFDTRVSYIINQSVCPANVKHSFRQHSFRQTLSRYLSYSVHYASLQSIHIKSHCNHMSVGCIS